MDAGFSCPRCGSLVPYEEGDDLLGFRFTVSGELRIILCTACPTCRINIWLGEIDESSPTERYDRTEREYWYNG